MLPFDKSCLVWAHADGSQAKRKGRPRNPLDMISAVRSAVSNDCVIVTETTGLRWPKILNPLPLKLTILPTMRNATQDRFFPPRIWMMLALRWALLRQARNSCSHV